MKPEKTLPIPDIRQTNEWKQAEAKYSELAARFNETTEQIHALESRLASVGKIIDAEAGMLLRGDSINDNNSMNGLRAEHEQLCRYRDVIKHAQGMHEQAMSVLLGELSSKCRDEIMPSYRERVLAIAKALNALVQASEEEERFRDEAERKGISFTRVAPVMNVSWLIGRAYDNQSPAMLWLSEAKREFGIE